ncbi:alkaline phosphatase [Sphingobacterium pedocola]|uniref:Alkaline phosphatase n=1 Tax=Sphingobacterium pedocola TaxID=2082722 RepID=A0ABR9T6U1_9SPHI|nr:alkaline phosphatase [Sphingobacterium pedocola]MBE8721068.1 alkaline phosphatase [Sphingobacterium pedocola]
MNKKITTLLFLSFLFVLPLFGQKAKYIFFMIGDGMGLNQVNLAEIYSAELAGRNGVFPLVFTQFPYATFGTSYSLSHGVTDSAAGGTALAVGKKTKNGVIGMDSAATVPYKSIAYAAKAKGMKVGIATSVSIDHATPASFYANRPDRNMYYEIGLDLIKSNFDFFAGAGFLKPNKTFDNKEAPSLFPQFEKAGYRIVKGYNAFQQVKQSQDKIILTNVDGADPSALKYAIDQKTEDLKLADITAAAIEALSTTNKGEGFFLMVEGGKIDWACHANDGSTTIHEVLDFNESVQLAFEFYKKHPEETLIIVTADHETGGLGIGSGSSRLNTKALEGQKISQGELSTRIRELRKNNPDASWEEVKNVLQQNLGLWATAKVTERDEKELFAAYERSFVKHENETEKSLYANDDKLASLSISVLNNISSLKWASGGHSAAYIPIYAIGAGADLFGHKMDNVDIPKKVAEAAGLEL